MSDGFNLFFLPKYYFEGFSIMHRTIALIACRASQEKNEGNFERFLLAWRNKHDSQIFILDKFDIKIIFKKQKTLPDSYQIHFFIVTPKYFINLLSLWSAALEAKTEVIHSLIIITFHIEKINKI